MTEPPGFPPPDDDMLAAEYAIGLLEGDERETARARVVADPAFAARVTTWQAQLARMADLDPVAPPASARAAVLDRVFPPAPEARFWRPLGLWRSLAGAAVGAASVFAAIVFLREAPPPPARLFPAEIVSPEGDFRVVALVDKRTNEVTLTRTAGAASVGRILQVWAHGPGEPARSVGLWPDGEVVRLRLPPEIAAVEGVLTLGVSEEPPGGSPTGLPSGRVFGTVDIHGV